MAAFLFERIFFMNVELKNCACFGVAGNFTGHLEQAGEAIDFKNVTTKEDCAPKALFPTFLPENKNQKEYKSINGVIPDFLRIFPFDSEKILFPKGESKLQIEPECAVIFDVEWNDGKAVSLKPIEFGASNDCSIRKEGAKKISLKKNWGLSSKGFSPNRIKLENFNEKSKLSEYRIASFLVRDGKAYAYGEDSRVCDYSYIWKKLTDWILDRLNEQKDEGPCENVNAYLKESGYPENLFVSIGATRYTAWGQSNFLSNGDRSVVILYPEGKYSEFEIEEIALGKLSYQEDVSVLNQKVVM